VPAGAELPERLDRVLHVIYLVFNEGYSASSGKAVVRADLTAEAIRLARLLAGLLPHPDVAGLLSLLLLQDSRRAARQDGEGALVLLADQDRSRWDRGKIAEGLALLAGAMRTPEIGLYTVQAAIAAEHARTGSIEETDWRRIAFNYDLLIAAHPSDITELNRAVAIAMADGPEKGLALVDAVIARGDLKTYHLAHSARADFLRRLGRRAEAIQAYETALAFCRQEPEQAFLRKRILELTT
jgi:RNA polymerase sigma-70 factor (ECF subfamily)